MARGVIPETVILTWLGYPPDMFQAGLEGTGKGVADTGTEVTTPVVPIGEGAGEDGIIVTGGDPMVIGAPVVPEMVETGDESVVTGIVGVIWVLLMLETEELEGTGVGGTRVIEGVKSLALKCHWTLRMPRLRSPMEANAEGLRTMSVEVGLSSGQGGRSYRF